MSFAARHHQPTSAPAGFPPLAGAFVESFTLPDSAGITFNSNGTITGFNEYTGPAQWHPAPQINIGENFDVRFTLISGDAWDLGNESGFWTNLASNKGITLSASAADKYSVVTVDIRQWPGGATVSSGTITLGVYDEP